MSDEPIVEVVEEAPARAENGQFAKADNSADEADNTDPDLSAPEGEGDEQAEAGDEDGDLPEQKKRGKNAQARFDQLTRKVHDRDRRIEALERLVTAQTPNSTQDVAPKPSIDDFASYDEFIEALTDWKVDNKLSKRSADGATKASAEIRNASWESKVEAAKASIPDYDKVVLSSDLQIAQHVADALMEADNGPELAYHMAAHPEVLDKLNKLSPIKAAMELSKLELAAPVVKPASKAPPPVAPLKTTGSAVPTKLATASMDEYIAERRKQGARF